MSRMVEESDQDQLALRSSLSEISRLPGWIEGISSRHAIPGSHQFSISLCLEEALSNIILHGYSGADDRPITVKFMTHRGGYLVFVIDDEAPPFNPLEAPEMAALNPREEVRVGGQGIRFLRHFSDTLEYERLAGGNRLRIGFSSGGGSSPGE